MQVTDPRSREWATAVDHHLRWWDTIIAAKRKLHQPITITPEFGPFPYMVNNPRTGDPIGSQWEINIYMMQLLKERYALINSV